MGFHEMSSSGHVWFKTYFFSTPNELGRGSLVADSWWWPEDSRTGSFSGFCLSLGYRIPCGLFTPGSFYPVVFANFLVLKDLAKWRDLHFSRIFRRLLTYELRVLSRSVGKSDIRG
jgi:hypothetical protein